MTETDETDSPQPDLSADSETELDAAIHKHVERKMYLEGRYHFATVCLGVLAGALKWGWLGAILGLFAGLIVGMVVKKVAVAFH